MSILTGVRARIRRVNAAAAGTLNPLTVAECPEAAAASSTGA